MPQAPWTPAHNAAVTRAIVAVVLANRKTIYASPGLEDVGNNGGSRINQKIQQILKTLPGAEESVNAETKGKGVGGVKAKGGAGRKRRRAEVDDDEEEKDCKPKIV